MSNAQHRKKEFSTYACAVASERPRDAESGQGQGTLERSIAEGVKEHEVGVCVGKLEGKASRGRCSQLGLLPMIGRPSPQI